MQSHLPMSPQVFTILNALIEERTGLHYALSDLDLFASKVSARAVEAGFDSLLDYYYFLRYDAGSQAELTALVDALVVNETFFFREIDQLRVVPQLVAPLVRKGMRPRIWSAACSTGEEPFTLAMLLATQGLLAGTTILASDISTRVLARAKAGVFGQRSVRHVPATAFEAGWLTHDGADAVASAKLLAAVDFRQVNLMNEDEVAALGTFDVVLCRNVLIYFRDDVARQVVERLTRRLAPGGALFVGVSESLLRFGTSLTSEEVAGAFLYRKSGGP